MNATGMGIGMWLFWIIVIVGIALLFRLALRSTAEQLKPAPGALEILKQRYARGEIDSEEYERRKQELQR